MIDGKETVFVVVVIKQNYTNFADDEIDGKHEMTVSAFDNRENAEKYKNWWQEENPYGLAIVEEVPVYSKFLIDGE